VGINPLMSMLSSILELSPMQRDFEAAFLYSTKFPASFKIAEVLFLDRLLSIFRQLRGRNELQLFFTGAEGYKKPGLSIEETEVKVQMRRMIKEDMLGVLGPVEERKGTLCYICGVAEMTDEFVAVARETEGMVDGRVLCERWW